MKEFKLSFLEHATTFILCSSAIILTAVICFGYYFIHDRTLMAENMNNAIEKGIDPLSVRCSYVKSDDIICVTFAASNHTNPAAPSVKR